MLFGCLDDAVWIRVRGKGSFEISPHLKRFAERGMEKGLVRFVVDLEECPVMDSTFMGTLLGIATKLMDRHGELGIANANERNLQLLRNLGLDAVLTVDAEGSGWPELRRRAAEGLNGQFGECGAGQQERAEVVLEAHEALAQLNEENAPRFQDVIDYLKRELREQQR